MLKNKIKKIAKENFKDQEYSLYILGSFAYKDYIKSVSDIDFIIIFKDELNDSLYLKIKNFIKQLKLITNLKYDAVFCSDNQIGINKNKVIYYNDNKLNFDYNCGNIAPVNWYELKTIGILISGEDIKYKITTSIKDVLDYCKENINSYWTNWIIKLKDKNFNLDSESLVWCTLGISRLIYLLENNKLCSKTKAGKYSIKNYGSNFELLLMNALELRKSNNIKSLNELKGNLINYMKFCIDRFNSKY